MVASQDCDVVAPTSTEPHVDLLPAVVRTDPENDLLHGKNPRRLCLALGNVGFAIVDIRQRITVEKRLVAGITPLSQGLKPRDRRLLGKWLGKRYQRSAFPDEFNRRLRKTRSRLESLSKQPEGRDITAILMMLDTDEELSSDRSYKVVVWFACRSRSFENPKIRVAVEKYAQEFADTMDSCGGIEIQEHEVKQHLDITLEDLEVMKRFDYDYRSESPRPGGDSVSEECE